MSDQAWGEVFTSPGLDSCIPSKGDSQQGGRETEYKERKRCGKDREVASDRSERRIEVSPHDSFSVNYA
jgi:hypothetical protein